MRAEGLDRGQLHEIFHALVLCRAVEEQLTLLLQDARVEPPYFPSFADEAGAVGSAYALRRRTDGTGDVIAPSLRSSGAVLLLGGTPLEIFRHTLGRATGPTAGRDGSIHWTDLQRGLLGPVSPPGLMVEVMAGITLSFRLKGEERVGIVYSSSGERWTGAWHEGLNLAAVQRCPMVLVAEAAGARPSRGARQETRPGSLAETAAGYGIAVTTVDAWDVLAIHAVTADAIRRARDGAGVTLVELRSPEASISASGDPKADPEERDAGVSTEAGGTIDPIDHFRARLVDGRWATADELAALCDHVERDVLRAAEQAAAEPEPVGPEALGPLYMDTPLQPPRSPRPDILPHGA